MKLYLMQHGNALSKDIDPERPLSETGLSEVKRLAAMLSPQMPVSRIVHSGKTRAHQTAQCFAHLLADGQRTEAIGGIKPNDEVEDFAQQLKDWRENTLVVGHLPFMGKLVAHLIAGSSEYSVVAYQPGSVVCLETDSAGRWLLQWMIRPELLDETVR